jgi:hypothetical protein
MARNGSGTMTRVSNSFSNPVTGTTIDPTDADTYFDDVDTELTNSVAVDGQSTMTGALKAANGTVGAPAYTFGSDPDSGHYRIGANNIGLAVGGSKIADYGAASIAFAVPISNTSAVLTTPNIGTPSAGVLTSCTGLPIATGVSGLGTGIAAALAVNTGSAGAPVLFNGALGTPLSGTLTNCTIPVTGVSGLGTGVATALAVNVGSAGAPVLFNGALGTPSSGTLTNCSLPVSQLTGASAGAVTFLTTASSANLATMLTDETGTGAAVFATSPTFVTPILGTPTSGTLTNCTIPVTGVSGLGAGGATFLATPSSANLRSFLTDETGTGGAVFATSPTITTPNVVGTVAADSAAAGSVGEYIESILATGSATALTSATAKTVTSITLSAGDWDLTGIVYFLTGASTNVTNTISSYSTSTNTLDTTAGRFAIHSDTGFVPGNLTGISETLPRYRFNVSGSTTVYLIAYSTFTVSTNSAWGMISARRVR